jgi:hypothetical protein
MTPQGKQERLRDLKIAIISIENSIRYLSEEKPSEKVNSSLARCYQALADDKQEIEDWDNGVEEPANYDKNIIDTALAHAAYLWAPDPRAEQYGVDWSDRQKALYLDTYRAEYEKELRRKGYVPNKKV